MDSRQQRFVENEKIFRKANNRLETQVQPVVAPNQEVPFVCECIDRDCLERVELTLEDYQQIRADENLFLIAPGHPMMDGERLVSENQQVWVVAKPAGV